MYRVEHVERLFAHVLGITVSRVFARPEAARRAGADRSMAGVFFSVGSWRKGLGE